MKGTKQKLHYQDKTTAFQLNTTNKQTNKQNN